MPPAALGSSSAGKLGSSPSARPPQLPARRPSPPPQPLRSSPPPSASPDFLIPRPPSIPPAAAGATARAAAPDAAVDPWRERIAQLEIQLSAARAAATRAGQDATASRERAEALASRLDRVEGELLVSIERVEEVARDALSRADKPLPLAGLEGRTSELETVAQTARAGVSALRQELAENRRLDEARAMRLGSIEDRVSRLEGDPRADELRLAIDRVESRVIAVEREQASLRERVESVLEEMRSERARMADAVAKAEKAFARIEELAEAQDELRASSGVDVLLPRIADLESLVLENGRNDAKLAKELEALRDQMAQPVEKPAANTGSAPLRGISGIGPKMESKLRALGIADRAALAALDDAGRARVAGELGVKRDKLDAWCEAARE